MALKQAFSTTDGVTDLLYVATHLNLCCNPIPESFVPVDIGVEAPIDPGSLEATFGAGSGYEFEDLYVAYYDAATNTWRDGESAFVPADVKADVATHLEALVIYEGLLAEYNEVYNVQREVQWKKHVAQALIDVCAS